MNIPIRQNMHSIVSLMCSFVFFFLKKLYNRKKIFVETLNLILWIAPEL